MSLFNLQNNNLKSIKKQKFELEKQIQTISEQNLELLFGLKFIKSEFALHKFRIDTLAFDVSSKSFVIIEYKRDQNFSVIDQGYAYLSLLLNNEADFILEYNENNSTSLKREGVDWSQSRVIFVSPSFSKYQKQAINFRNLPIELWEVNKFENSLIEYKKLEALDSAESIEIISQKNQTISKVSKEIEVYSEEDLLKYCDEIRLEIYEELKTSILNLNQDVQIIPKKHYIAFKTKTNFLDITPQKDKLKIWLNLRWGELDNHSLYKNMRNVEKIGHYGNGDYEFTIAKKDQIIDLLPLIKQSLEKNAE